MSTYRHGRHEYGQNFLTDQSIIAAITRLAVATEGPIIEIGPGDGALTTPLARLGRPVTAIEIDARLARRLSERLPSHVDVVSDDFLIYRLPTYPYVLVGVRASSTEPSRAHLGEAFRWRCAGCLE